MENNTGTPAVDLQDLQAQIEQLRKENAQLKSQLQQSNSKGKAYQNIYNNSLVAILKSDANTGEIIDANEKAWKLFGFEGPVEKVRTVDYYVEPTERDRLLKQIMEDGYLDNEEIEIESNTGERKWVTISTKYQREEGVLESIMKDITEAKQHLFELEKVNFELDSFVYHASHDLRSPLRSVLGLIDIYRLEDDPKVKEQCIEKIESSIKRLDNLVVELLSISRNNRVNDPHVKVDFLSEINNSVSSYLSNFEKGLEIITKVNQTIPFYSDLTRIRIVLNNLISNAMKYRNPDQDRCLVQVMVDVQEDKAIIRIEDNGEGIPREKLPHIFDMFYRATEKSEGSGLGLYIVKNVLDKLNATIDIDSAEWEGTRVKVEIPASQSSDGE